MSSTPVSNSGSYKVNYDPQDHQLNVLDDQQNKIGKLVAEDFTLKDNEWLYVPQGPARVIINGETRHTIRCLEIKEKRLRFAELHPVASGVLSVISSIGIAIFALPWAIAWTLFMRCDEGMKRSTEGTLNKIRPVFIPRHLKESIDEDKKKLATLVEKIEKTFDQQYFDNLEEAHNKNVTNQGVKGWKNNPKCRALYKQLFQAQIIAKDVLGREVKVSVAPNQLGS